MPVEIPEPFITPVLDTPEKVMLWNLLNKLETYDSGPSSRVALATNLFYAAQTNNDQPLFEEEIAALRAMFKLTPRTVTDPTPTTRATESKFEPSFEEL